MTKYRVAVHKILEDGSEVEIMRCVDQGPWYVAAAMVDFSKRLKRLPPDDKPKELPGQMPLGEAA